jgi:predicted transcriptional regulator
MTKHLNDDWMYERNYITEEECTKGSSSDLIPNTDWGQDMTVNDLTLPQAVFLDATTSIGEAIELFYSKGFAQFPVREASGKITGVLTKTETMKQLVKQRVTREDPVSMLVQRELRHVSGSVTLAELGRILARNRFALVDKTKFVTTSDLLNKIAPKKPAKACCKPAPKDSCC